jgi:hypothetical protein
MVFCSLLALTVIVHLRTAPGPVLSERYDISCFASQPSKWNSTGTTTGMFAKTRQRLLQFTNIQSQSRRFPGATDEGTDTSASGHPATRQGGNRMATGHGGWPALKRLARPAAVQSLRPLRGASHAQRRSPHGRDLPRRCRRLPVHCRPSR